MPKAKTGVLKLWWIMEFSIGKSQKIEPIFKFMKKNCQRTFEILDSSDVYSSKTKNIIGWIIHSLDPTFKAGCM